MLRTLFIAVIVAATLSSVVFAGEVIATKNKDVTSKDVPLKFVLEKTVWDGEDINIWGTVTNKEKTTYRNVSVIFTVKDADGKFIGRKGWFVEPDTVGPNQVGYIEKKFVSCEQQKPATVEFSVVGDKE